MQRWQKDEREKIASRLVQEIAEAPDIEKDGFVMKSPMEMIMSHSPVQHPDLKFCYVRMKDGREMKFESFDELVAFIHKEAIKSAHEEENGDNDEAHFRESTKTEREEPV